MRSCWQVASPGTDLWRSVPGLYSHIRDGSARNGYARGRAVDYRPSIDTVRLCACGVEKFWCSSCQPGLYCSPGHGMRSHTLSLACVALPDHSGLARHSSRRRREDTLRATFTTRHAFWYGGSYLSAGSAIASTATPTRTGDVVESASVDTERTGLVTYRLSYANQH